MMLLVVLHKKIKPWLILFMWWCVRGCKHGVGVAAQDVTDDPDKKTVSSFIWLSDIHFDPYYGTPLAQQYKSASCNDSKVAPVFGQVGCDSPLMLIESLLQHANATFSSQSQSQGPDFLVITGDLSRHGTEELEPDPVQQLEDILFNVSTTIKSMFPNVPIAVSIGNNDVTPDYYLDVEDPSEQLNMLANGFQPLFDSEDQANMMRQGGYYLVNATQNLTILCLNTIIYATDHEPAVLVEDEDPLAQFAWLEQQLVAAENDNRRVYLTGHIPPTVGSYRHTQLWNEMSSERYYEILNAHESVIAGQFFGHIHTDEFRSHHDFVMFITSSVTPIYGSNPSYRVVKYDSESGTILDYDTYYLDLANVDDNNDNDNDDPVSSVSWKQPPSFRQAFEVDDLSVNSLNQIINELAASPDAKQWEPLLSRQHIYAHGSELCEAQCRREWVCTLQSMTKTQYNTCLLRPLSSSWSSSSPLGVSLVVVIAAFFALAWGIREVRRRWCLTRKEYEATPGSATMNHPAHEHETVDQHHHDNNNNNKKHHDNNNNNKKDNTTYTNIKPLSTPSPLPSPPEIT